MFESFTYDSLLESLLDKAPDGVDTRQGSVFYDAVAPMALLMQQYYINLDVVYQQTQIDEASGEALDAKASEHGLTRHSAIAAEYYITFTGTAPFTGQRFYVNDLYWVLNQEVDSGNYYIQCETTGLAGNGITSGTNAVPVTTVSGLTSATVGSPRINGSEEESDDDLRSRIKVKISGPAQNGNTTQYQTWCESIDGVGMARIVPLWNGPNTVKAILLSVSGQPCPSNVVTNVPKYIDPATKGYTATVDGITYVVGDGVGDGVAPLGSHFTACAPQEYKIDVTFTVSPQSGYTADNVKEDATKAITAYLEERNTSTYDGDAIVVRYTNIGALISGLASVLDYSDLVINGGTTNIRPGNNYAAVMGEVSVSAS